MADEGKNVVPMRFNGTCVVRLRKALYGCVDSGAMWFNRLSTGLESLDYKRKKLDLCLFDRIEKENAHATLILHVNDMQ